MDQELLFESVRCLAIVEASNGEKELLENWHRFFRSLWKAASDLENHEWGRSVRLQLGFIVTRLRDELRRLELGEPRLRGSGVGYICDSLRCQLQVMERFLKGD